MTYQVISIFICNAILGQPCSLGCLVYNQIHDSIKATTKLKDTSNSTPNALECVILRAACQNAPAPKLSQKIDKNAIIANYGNNCQKTGYSGQVITTKKGEPTELPTTYPSIYELVCGCSMKPSDKHQYPVIDPVLDNIVVCILSPQDMYLSADDVETLSSINLLYRKMVHDVMRLKGMEFPKLREPRIGHAMQQKIQQSHVDLAAAALIHYCLHPGMPIPYVKGKYVGENRDVFQVLNDVSPFIDEVGCESH